MVILAGIDEAGLGPTLGPLATASAALSVPDDWLPDTPWRELADAVADAGRARDPRPAVADSKELYRTGGMPALELAAGAFSILANLTPRAAFSWHECEASAQRHPCYSGGFDPLPRFRDEADLARAAESVRIALRRAGAASVHLEATLLCEPALNRRFALGLNKNQALLMETGRHLTRVAEKFPDLPVLAVVDKQGGRNDYMPFLSALFPGSWIDRLTEGGPLSAYRIRRPGGDLTVRFLAKADRESFPTALASLAAKYARERAMSEFNAWFAARAADVKPTAGYPQDAKRWLAEIRAIAGSGDWELGRVIRQR